MKWRNWYYYRYFMLHTFTSRKCYTKQYTWDVSTQDRTTFYTEKQSYIFYVSQRYSLSLFLFLSLSLSLSLSLQWSSFYRKTPSQHKHWNSSEENRGKMWPGTIVSTPRGRFRVRVLRSKSWLGLEFGLNKGSILGSGRGRARARIMVSGLG
jgi:hypothetical protein